LLLWVGLHSLSYYYMYFVKEIHNLADNCVRTSLNRCGIWDV
jgi:hypothetical protein